MDNFLLAYLENLFMYKAHCTEGDLNDTIGWIDWTNVSFKSPSVRWALPFEFCSVITAGVSN